MPGPRGARLIGGVALLLAACHLTDLVTGSQSSPTIPVSLQQAAGSGAAVIARGAVTHDSTVTFSATVGDPDARDSLSLQVEARPVAVAFADSATASGATVANGATAAASQTGFTENTAYHWQARVIDETGRLSPWVPFGDNPTGDPDFVVDAVAEPPPVPASLAQLKSDGVTAIPVGSTTDETTVVFRAFVTDPDPGDSVRLEVETQPLGTAFGNVPTATSAGVASGDTARLTLSGQTDNVSYHWQARAIDRAGLVSGWVSFGGNSENQQDYRASIPQPPDVPSTLGQFLQNGQTPIAVGGTTTQATVAFKATVTDVNGDQVRLEVEVRPIGVPFTGTATATGALVASGATARADATGLSSGTSYHWQVRGVDQTGRASAWVSFGNNDESMADFSVQ